MSEVQPVVDEGLGNSSYLVDLGDGRALVVDPVRDPGPYLELAQQRRLRVTHSVETHLHADFVSGSRELAARGARVVAETENPTSSRTLTSASARVVFPAPEGADNTMTNDPALTPGSPAAPGTSPAPPSSRSPPG